MCAPDLSVVIPVYNRGDLIGATIESVCRASVGLTIEVIVIDDGSTEPAAVSLDRLGFSPTKVVRQPNRGLLFARLAGLAEATGRYVLFLDSDDLVGRDQLASQFAAMEAQTLDVSYVDTARAEWNESVDRTYPVPDPPTLPTTDPVGFFLRVQPAPHSPMFRTAYLKAIAGQPGFPPSPLYNAVAEIWFYHKAAPFEARIEKVEGPRAICCRHGAGRLTDHWERLGVASLAVMEGFARQPPPGPHAAAALACVAENALRAWRAHPYGFPAELDDRLLHLWHSFATDPACPPGGRRFRWLCRLLGTERACRWLRRLQRPSYDRIRTLDDDALSVLIRMLPPPPMRSEPGGDARST
jgi:hypothetical protein